MYEQLITNNRRVVMLDKGTQIEIMQLLEEGKSYEQIDSILEVSRGSSEYTINTIQKVCC